MNPPSIAAAAAYGADAAAATPPPPPPPQQQPQPLDDSLPPLEPPCSPPTARLDAHTPPRRSRSDSPTIRTGRAASNTKPPRSKSPPPRAHKNGAASAPAANGHSSFTAHSSRQFDAGLSPLSFLRLRGGVELLESASSLPVATRTTAATTPTAAGRQHFSTELSALPPDMHEAGLRLPPRQPALRLPTMPAGTPSAVAASMAAIVDAAAAAGGAEGGIECASVPLTDGFVVYRALLCCAVCTQTEGCCPGSETVRSGVHRPSALKLVSSCMWQRLRDAHLADPSAPLLGHQQVCKLVLAKTTVMQAPRVQLRNQLQYELVALKQVAARSSAASQSASSASPSSLPAQSDARSPSISTYCRTQSETQGLPALPALMTLPDDRMALVQSDALGCTVEEIISSADLKICNFTQPPRARAAKDEDWSASQSNAMEVASYCSVTLLPLHELSARLRGIVACALSICISLDQLHAAGIVHKSLHPSSIILPPRCIKTAVEGDESQQVPLPDGCMFLDLGHSSLLPREKARSNTTLDSLSFSQWLYSAPECSGRTRSIIDNRSDLYALGALLYTLVCGESPFARAGSAAEVIHHHLAVAPASLVPTYMTADSHPARHSMLSCINAVIQKLLNKSAEDRYQCCAGLIFDLRHILSVLVHEAGRERLLASPKASALLHFKIGERDWSGTLRLSQKLYGRDHELAVLLEALQELRNKKQSTCSGHRRPRVSPGALSPLATAACTMVLLRACAGVGKTALCDELQKHILRQRGLLARAAFTAEGDPSSVVVLQAFRSLVLQLLAVDSVLWRVRLLRTLGSQNCSVLAESLPELENLVGPLPAPPKLSAHDLAAHTRIAFVQLVAALSTADSPFTLIVDNMHHANTEALQLLHQLFTHATGGAGSLLIVAAFRTPPSDHDHPLCQFIRQVRLIGSPKMNRSVSAASSSSMRSSRSSVSGHVGARVIELQLNPLSVNDVQQLLQDSFPRVDQPLPALAHILLTKTQGSPFFLLQLLRSLYSRRLLRFDFETGVWQWQLADIVAFEVPSDVVGVLTSHMAELSERAQKVLQYAACIGRSFSLQALATVTDMPQSQLVASVCELERQGMLMCTAHANELAILNSAECVGAGGSVEAALSDASSSTCRSSSPAVSCSLDEIVLQFAHDHVRDAAYKLSPTDISRLHLHICDRLLDTHSLSELTPMAREIVSHYMAGCVDCVADLCASLFTTRPPRMQLLMQLARAAGTQARKAGEFANARDFFTQALKLLDHIAEEQDKTASSTPAMAASSSPSACASCPAAAALPLKFDFRTVSASVWSRWYDVALSVYAELGLTLLLTGELVLCEQVFDYVHLHAHNVVDLSPFFVLNLASLRQQNRLVEAVCCSLKHIAELGLKMIEQPSPELLAFLKPPSVSAEAKRDWDEAALEAHPICKLPRNRDPQALVSMQLLVAMLPLLVRLASPILSSVAATLNELTVSSGLCAESAVGVGLHALSLWQQDLIEDAHWTMQLAMHLARTWQDGRSTLAQVQAMGVCRIFPWILSLRECSSIAMATADDLASEGDLHNASYVVANAAVQAVLSGANLDTVQVQLTLIMERHRSWSTHAPTLAHTYLWLRLVQRLQLTGPAGDDVSLEWRAGEWKTDQRLIEEGELDHNFFLGWSGRIACGIAAFFEGQVHHAAQLLESSWSSRARMAGFVDQGALAFYLALALCATLPPRPVSRQDSGLSFDDHAATEVTNFSPEQPPSSNPTLSDADRAHVQRTLESINQLIRQMSVWVAAAPSTHLHRLQLMQAERCLLCYTHLGSRHLLLPGLRLMQESGDQALRSGFLLEYAVILERHYLYHTACARDVPSRYWLAHAHQAYADARCALKVKRLEAAHPVLTSPSQLITHVMSAGNPTLSQQTLQSFRSVMRGCAEESASPPTSPSIAFDLFSVLKATSSLSTEKDESKLLRRTMTLMIETAGASRGVLILRPRDNVSTDGATEEEVARGLGHTESVDGWCVELEANVNDTEPKPLPDVLGAQAAQDGRNTPSFSEIGSARTSASPASSSPPPDEAASAHIRIEAPRSALMEDVLPVSLLSYIVSARESVMLSEPERESASAFDAFSQDPYFATHHPKAIMCTPLMRGGRVYGGLYLENALNPEAFTTSHVQLLQLLCSQAALSIDNARLYARLEASHATLERLVQFRTAELVDKNTALQTAMEMAEKASKVKSDFLSSMSHELRTPMNAVLGVSRLLADTPLCDEQRHYLSMIINSGHLLMTIINDILDYSKLEAGQLRLELSPQNLLSTVETATLLCCSMADAKGLDVGWFVEPSIPALLMLDATRLQQILLNLLSNAIKFTRVGGVKVEVTGNPAPADHAGARYEVRISVRDTGIGITEENLKKLFLSFSQVHPCIDPMFGGTGLGLVISKRLVEAMGGDIRVHSEVGRGSEFEFTIATTAVPPTPASPSLYALSPDDAAELATIRLLWVSGREARSWARTRLLRCFGVQIERAETLEIARSLLQSSVPHCIVLDSDTDCDGLLFKYHSILKTLLAFPRVQLLALTNARGSAASAAATRSLAGGEVAFVSSDAASRRSSRVDADMISQSIASMSSAGPANLAAIAFSIPLQERVASMRQPSEGEAAGDKPARSSDSVHVASSRVHTTLAEHRADIERKAQESRGAQERQRLSGEHALSQAESERVTHLTKPFASSDLIRHVILAARQCKEREAEGVAMPPLRRDSTTGSVLSLSSSSSPHQSAVSPSVAGSGAGFNLPSPMTLSRASTTSSASSSRIMPIAKLFPLRILLAEDNLVNQKVMRMLLKKLGYECLVANHGAHALQILEEQRVLGPEHEIEVILMDQSMDVMDGMECTRIIRATQSDKHLRPFIIAQTANASDDFSSRCMSSGFDRFISKPIRVELLSESLQTAYLFIHAHEPAESSVSSGASASSSASVSTLLTPSSSLPSAPQPPSADSITETAARSSSRTN